MRKILFLCLLVYSSLNALEVLYESNIPFIKKEKNTISGYSANSIIKALDSLKINYTLKEQPFKNQLTILKSNKKEVCAVAWKKDSRYDSFVNYTDLIYQERPNVIITQKRYEMESNIHIDRIITEKKYRVMVKKDYPYSKDMQKILNMLPKKIIKTNKDYNLVTLIAKRRGDYTFLSYEKAHFYTKKHKYRSRFKLIPVLGMPKGQSRYLACSKNVDLNIINELNKQLK